MKKEFPKGLYAITAEGMSNSKDNITVVKEMLEAGIKIIQYRQKEKSKIEKFEQCKIIRQLTADFNCLFIVNDDIDIAMAVKSDGFHIGQDDLPIIEVRKIVGENFIIGLSTHSPIQAQKAVADGADYIGVGPIYKTLTKISVPPVGLEYLDFCVNNIKIPKVAIGGIKLSNLSDIAIYKPENICMVSEITASQDIGQTIKRARELMDYGN
jgi:thiamine-phosphate pyrophosphorylase